MPSYKSISSLIKQIKKEPCKLMEIPYVTRELYELLIENKMMSEYIVFIGYKYKTIFDIKLIDIDKLCKIKDRIGNNILNYIFPREHNCYFDNGDYIGDIDSFDFKLIKKLIKNYNLVTTINNDYNIWFNSVYITGILNQVFITFSNNIDSLLSHDHCYVILHQFAMKIINELKMLEPYVNKYGDNIIDHYKKLDYSFCRDDIEIFDYNYYDKLNHHCNIDGIISSYVYNFVIIHLLFIVLKENNENKMLNDLTKYLIQSTLFMPELIVKSIHKKYN